MFKLDVAMNERVLVALAMLLQTFSVNASECSAPAQPVPALELSELHNARQELLLRSIGKQSCFTDMTSAQLFSAAKARLVTAGEWNDKREEAPATDARIDPKLAANLSATVLLVHEDDLVPRGDGGWIAKASTAAELGACGCERFAEQVSILSRRTCSGVLLKSDEVLTAGHCVPDNFALFQIRVVLGFRLSNGKFPTEFDADQVYEADKVVARTDPCKGNADLVTFKLARSVTTYTPISTSRTGPAVNDDVYLLGFPAGLPMKLTSNSKVVSNDPALTHFVSDLSTYEGNSGAPVFNKSHELVGIHQRGVTYKAVVGDCWMWTWNDKRKCGGACATRYDELFKTSGALDSNKCKEKPEGDPDPSPYIQYVEARRGARREIERRFSPP